MFVNKTEKIYINPQNEKVKKKALLAVERIIKKHLMQKRLKGLNLQKSSRRS